MTAQEATVLAAAVGGLVALVGAFLADLWARGREGRAEQRQRDREGADRIRQLAIDRVTQTGQAFWLTWAHIGAFTQGDAAAMADYRRQELSPDLWLAAVNYVGRDEVLLEATQVVSTIIGFGFGVGLPRELDHAFARVQAHVAHEMQDQVERALRGESLLIASEAAVDAWNLSVRGLVPPTATRGPVTDTVGR